MRRAATRRPGRRCRVCVAGSVRYGSATRCLHCLNRSECIGVCDCLKSLCQCFKCRSATLCSRSGESQKLHESACMDTPCSTLDLPPTTRYCICHGIQYVILLCGQPHDILHAVVYSHLHKRPGCGAGPGVAGVKISKRVNCALVFRPVSSQGAPPPEPRPAGCRCRGRPRVNESVTSLIHAKNIKRGDESPRSHCE